MPVYVAHFCASVYPEIVEFIVKATSIVVVDHTAISIIIRYNEIVVDIVLRGDYAGFPRGHSREEALPIPSVDCSMVTALPTSLKQKIVRNIVPSTETIIEIEARTWDVKA